MVPPPSLAEEHDLPALLEKAVKLELDKDPYWHTLLHYRPSLFGTKSLIDDPDFFLAEGGATQPSAELEETLRGFFRPDYDSPDKHPRCRYPARYRWLDSHLDLSGVLEPQVCPEFERISGEISPQSAELIFPGSNFNNPASMFGHTLVSINGPHKSKLLSHAVNYAAFTREKNGVVYAVKGIFGFYQGYYSVLPYYAKLKQYNDLERRDIWEYELNLTAEEVERLFLHLWELEEIYSDYYFFDENCAYQLLFLFDAARPNLGLVDQARPWVIPVDTVRLLEKNGVITGAAYRPSKATRIAWIVEHMSSQEKNLTALLLDEKESPEAVAEASLDEAGEVRVLDMAIETLEFKYLKRDVERPEYRKRYLSLLKQRSYLDPEDDPVPDIPVPSRPDKGHGSNRLALLGGEKDDQPFAELRIRPAYHNLLDADDGYLPGSQIDFANVVIRYYEDVEKFRLQGLDLVSIVSLTPRHRFYRPVSWKVDAGFKRLTFQDGIERMLFSVNPGGGFTYGNARTMAFVMFETDLQISEQYRDNYMLGFGGSVGVLARLGENLKVKVDARQVGYPYGDESYRDARVGAGLNWKLSVNSSLVVEACREKRHGLYSSELKGGLNYYW